MNKYKVLIIGAGKIGAFFDNPCSENILTHAHAFSDNEAFELVGFVDSDTEKARKAAELWGGESYANIDEAFLKEKNIDVISICVPDDFHYQILKEISEKPVRLVFAEKPITQSAEEAEEIVRLYEEKKISLLVNYSRRFVPEFITLKDQINKSDFGDFVCGSAYYGKGVAHNGSHMIDLVRSLVSEVDQAVFISSESDFYKDDPSVSAVLQLKNNRHISLLSVDCRKYSIFELDLLFDKGRVFIKDSGNIIEYYDLVESQIYEGYKYLNKNREIKTQLNKSIYFAVMNIKDHLGSDQELLCDIGEAFLNLKSALAIKKLNK